MVRAGGAMEALAGRIRLAGATRGGCAYGRFLRHKWWADRCWYRPHKVTAATNELHRRLDVAERGVAERTFIYLAVRLLLRRRLQAEDLRITRATLLRDVRADRMVATSAAELVEAATCLHRAQREVRSVEEQVPHLLRALGSALLPERRGGAAPVLADMPRQLRRLQAAAERMERRAARVRAKALQRHPGAARRGRVRR